MTAPVRAPKIGRAEARLLVCSLAFAWLLLSISDRSDLAWGISFLLGMIFWVVLYRIAQRAGPDRDFMGTVAIGFRMMLTPTWWHRVIAPASGWPGVLVDALLIGSLAASLLLGIL